MREGKIFKASLPPAFLADLVGRIQQIPVGFGVHDNDRMPLPDGLCDEQFKRPCFSDARGSDDRRVFRQQVYLRLLRIRAHQRVDPMDVWQPARVPGLSVHRQQNPFLREFINLMVCLGVFGSPGEPFSYVEPVCLPQTCFQVIDPGHGTAERPGPRQLAQSELAPQPLRDPAQGAPAHAVPGYQYEIRRPADGRKRNVRQAGQDPLADAIGIQMAHVMPDTHHGLTIMQAHAYLRQFFA